MMQKLNMKDWTSKDFRKAEAFAYNLKIDVDCGKIDLQKLKDFLSQKRIFVLRLLENPNLLEHDRFADLLWSFSGKTRGDICLKF
jgi:hypothetical protein